MFSKITKKLRISFTLLNNNRTFAKEKQGNYIQLDLVGEFDKHQAHVGTRRAALLARTSSIYATRRVPSIYATRRVPSIYATRRVPTLLG